MSIVLTKQQVYTDAETAVRQLTNLTDYDTVPSSLVVNAINLATNEINPCLKEEYLDSADPLLLEGKYMLAASYLLRSLACSSSFNQEVLHLGNVQEKTFDKSRDLTALAKEWEESAWYRLARFCQEVPKDTGDLLAIKNESYD